MGILYTGGEGNTLQEIIEKLGNKNYSVIMIRCLWHYEDEQEDDLIGYCKYENGILEPLDGDDYSLKDRFIKWEEWVDTDEDFTDNGQLCLCVWERGYTAEEVKEIEKGLR